MGLLRQCSYIFPEASLITENKVKLFNKKHRGNSQVFEINFSDDPWKMAASREAVERRNWPLTLEQPAMLLTCDGCGHCGSGVPATKVEAIGNQTLALLRDWGISFGASDNTTSAGDIHV